MVLLTDGLNRRIAALALPALGALVAEPLFVLVDSAMVGHLGAVPLAGLAAASGILQTVVGLMIFLAYATTPLVARRLGQGRISEALAAGIDGIWLALGSGIALSAGGWLLGDPVIGLFSDDAAVREAASVYLHISYAGLPAMLVVLAVTGVLRGLQDTRTPLLVVCAGVTANVGLNAVFIYGFGWGVAGSALGTVLAQIGMAAVLVSVVVRLAKEQGTSLHPQWGGVGRSIRDGAWIFLRTATLRAALLATVWLAAQLGTDTLAGYHVLFALFSVLGMAFDAIAVAGQALVGLTLGEQHGGRAAVRQVCTRLQQWGIVIGAGLTVVFVAGSPWVGRLFTSDAAVLTTLTPGIIAMGVTLPLSGYVFVLDGILIGAGDGRYLALAGVVNLIGMALWMWGVLWWSGAVSGPVSGPSVGSGVGPATEWRLVAVWSCFGVALMGMRALTLGLRIRGTAWMRLSSEY